MTQETTSPTDALPTDAAEDQERSAAIVAMRRVDLAELHASELQKALHPTPTKPDDEVSDGEKANIASVVAKLVKRHRAETDAWMRANGA